MYDRSIPSPRMSSVQSRGWLGRSVQRRRFGITYTACAAITTVAVQEWCNGGKWTHSLPEADHLQRSWGPHPLEVCLISS